MRAMSDLKLSSEPLLDSDHAATLRINPKTLLSELSLLLAELSDLPPKPPRSKLEPHRELIRELRRKGRTYREVSRFFAERLGLQVAPSTLHSFVKVRARQRKQVQFELPAVELPSAEPPVSARLAAFKAQPKVQESKRSRFVFQENEPLTLSTGG